jgi:hypothetical protein
MKKLLSIALLALYISSCSKESNKHISDNYNVSIHYHDSWFVSRTSYGTEDTVYSSTLQLSQSSDDILTVQYIRPNGSTSQWKLHLSGTSADSLVYSLPYGYDYLNAYLVFYPNNNSLKMHTVEKTNPSGGGHNITHDITSL